MDQRPVIGKFWSPRFGGITRARPGRASDAARCADAAPSLPLALAIGKLFGRPIEEIFGEGCGKKR
jgi:hypothetical protein